MELPLLATVLVLGFVVSLLSGFLGIGSNLAIVFFSSLAGFVGKLATGQIPWLPAVALVVGALPGAQLGSVVSRRTQPAVLRWGLAAVVAFAAVKMGRDVLIHMAQR